MSARRQGGGERTCRPAAPRARPQEKKVYDEALVTSVHVLPTAASTMTSREIPMTALSSVACAAGRPARREAQVAGGGPGGHRVPARAARPAAAPTRRTAARRRPPRARLGAPSAS